MKQNARIISIHAADTSGVCSALYELGGMTVVHDASGCNSTYATHDEPRWAAMPSMIYISGVTEAEAVLGDDAKFIDDVVSAARELNPAFIALCGSPVPMMVGTDFDALASEIEARTRIPTLGLHTSGMHSYLTGASEAFAALTERFAVSGARSADPSMNLLGVTPLDFSINGSAESMRKFFTDNGFRAICELAMTGTLEDVRRMGEAQVNLVTSYSGLRTAKLLQTRFGTPYVVGVPVGQVFAQELVASLHRVSSNGGNEVLSTRGRGIATEGGTAFAGESVLMGSLASAFTLETGGATRLLCPLETDVPLLAPGDIQIEDEDAMTRAFGEVDAIVADPLYAPIAPHGKTFYRFPHEAFSGRCYRREIPDFTGRKIELGRLQIC